MNKITGSASYKYDRLAAIYDRRWQDYINHSLAFFIDFADIAPETKVLDLACGTGELAQLILNKNPQQQITGVDISEAMLAIAKQKLLAYTNVNLHHAAATELPCSDRSFDLVICANAWHYFSDPKAVLLEIRRVLKPEGKVIILDWCRDYLPLKIGDRIFKLIDPAYQKCYTQQELEKLLIAASFAPVEDSKIRFGLIWELMAIMAIAKDSVAQS